MSLAKTSNQLDLSECGLTSVPDDVLALTDLEELSLAGNDLRELPDGLCKLEKLRKLQLSGNRLKSLPESLCCMPSLEKLWLDGNLMKFLPASLGALSALDRLSAVGNHLEELPDSIGNLQELKQLELAGNRLQALPASLGKLSKLEKLTLNGNALSSLPETIGGLVSLKSLALQENNLTALPSTITSLQALDDLNVADNSLSALPTDKWEHLKLLRICMLYGNQLEAIPFRLLQAPILKELWAESNPLNTRSVGYLLRDVARLPAERKFLVGLDSEQVEGVDDAVLAAANGRLQVGEIRGCGRGYFKLRRGPPGDIVSAAGITGERVLVVAFGSAPGVPNWGGLLERIRRAMQEPAHKCFDILYVVDAGRSWYSGGDDEDFQFWWDRLARVTGQYTRVLMLGDSMGATAALLFSPLATSVHAFAPQVDFMTASLRPGRDSAWLKRLTDRVLSNVAASEANITTHSSSWLHDLDQARLVPAEHAHLKVYSVSTHRLAYYLDGSGKLLPLIQGALLQEMGFPSGNVRLQNFV
ncbi:probable leucine-rich repeat-containing protein 7 at N-terminal half [Coccomyxa sp. Obi]|nr:probable leucine-rich repeat-containing protein 7 at N-terminal half [Coccomyxa sp. Obi]